MNADKTKAVSVYAHRGFWAGRFCENSREAFEFASQHGFRCECDVWLTSDGKPVVMHDETVDRTTTGHGAVSQFSSQQLQEIRCRVAERVYSPPPMLNEVADQVGLVEIKPADDELVRAGIQVMGGRKWTLQSFAAGNLIAAQMIKPGLPIAFLAEDEAGIHLALQNRWPIHLDHELLDDRIAKLLRDSGKPFGVWTVNSEADIRRVLKCGASTIISDHPDLVKRIATDAGLLCR